MDPDSVLNAIIGQESNWNPNSPTSVTGARGIGQIQPQTFAKYAKPGENINNASDNLNVSRRIISDYYQKYDGDPSRIATAYFSGPSNVAPVNSATAWLRNKSDPNGKTTASYVSDVAQRLNKMPDQMPDYFGAIGSPSQPAPINQEQVAPDYFGAMQPAQAPEVQTNQQQSTAPAHKFTIMDTWPVRLAKQIAGGLTLPGDVYQGNATVPQHNVLGGEDTSSIDRLTNLGGIIGTGGIPSLVSKSAPLIDPATAQLAQLARDKYGIPIRGGQLSPNQHLNYLDSILNGGLSETQHAALNSSIAKAIGEDADKVTPEVMANAKDRLSENYETIAANTTLKLDDKMGQDFTRIAGDAQSVLAENERSIVHNQIQNVLDKAQGSGEINGKTFQSMIRTGSPLDRATKSPDSNVKYYASQIKSALIDAMGRSAPDDMQALLKQTNAQYKAMKTIEPLVEKSPTGDLSPTLLMGAVRNSYGNMAYGGGGDLADLARIGQRFFKGMPQSGTQPRLSAAAGITLGGAGLADLGAMFYDPMHAGMAAGAAAAVGAGRMAYKAGMSKFLRSDAYANKLINRSLPDRTGPAPNMLESLMRSNVPYLPPGVSQIPSVTINARPGYYSQ